MSLVAGQPIQVADVLSMVSFEASTSNPFSLTTVAGEKVFVMAKGTIKSVGGSGNGSVVLYYNGVQKDANTTAIAGGPYVGFCLAYTETPGAATHDITVTINGGGGTYTLQDVVITVIRLKQA